MREFVNNADCSRNFAACYWAVNKILEWHPSSEELIWIPRSFFDENRALFSDAKMEHPPLVLAEWRPLSEKNPLKRLKGRMEQKRLLQRTVSKLDQSGERTDFESLLNMSRDQVLGKDCAHQAEITVDAWNAYLAIRFDLHTSVSLSSEIETSDDSYVGVGIEMIQNPEDKVINVEPLEGTPAAQAGIQFGDVLIAVNQEPIQNVSLDVIRSKIIGTEGSFVTLTILRGGKKLEFKIQRKKMTAQVTTKKLLQVEDKQIGYIRLRQFSQDSCAALKNDLQSLLEAQPKGLVLDLRENPGGLIGEAVCIASAFMPPGADVVKADGYPAQRTSGKPLTQLPLTVLINAGSASASELLAGALKENRRALVVGERSFGKGSFQGANKVPGHPMLEMLVTEGLYYTESGASPQLVGIIPDIEVYQDPAVSNEEEASPRAREQDKYLEILPRKGTARGPSDVRLARRVKECLAEKATPGAKYESLKKAGKKADHQLIYATEALAKCWQDYSVEEVLGVIQRSKDCGELVGLAKWFWPEYQRHTQVWSDLFKSLEQRKLADPAHGNSAPFLKDYQAYLEAKDASEEYATYLKALDEAVVKIECAKPKNGR